MKKKILVIILMLISLSLVGCSKKESNKKILEIDCNGKKETILVELDTTFKCELMDNEYEFFINRISDNELTINVSSFGLAKVKENDTISLLDENNIFTINKNTETILRTQTTDYSEDLKLNWR